MAFSEDFERVFSPAKEWLDGSEISLKGRSFTVISGHKGLSRLSSEEIVVRLKKGCVSIKGSSMKVAKASPDEIYLSGEISSVEFSLERGADEVLS